MSGDRDGSGFINLEFIEMDSELMSKRANEFYKLMKKRRTTRHFSTRDVPRELIERQSRQPVRLLRGSPSAMDLRSRIKT